MKIISDVVFAAQDILVKKPIVFRVKKTSKLGGSILSSLTLAACGGGGGGTNNPAPQQPTAPAPAPAPAPEPAPEPDFIESPVGTFTAQDDSDRTLDQANATTNLTVLGGGGHDTISTGSGDDTINGGDGNDTIIAGDGANIITSGAGNDAITSGLGSDSIEGGAGDDNINSGGGDDRISGNDGNDIIQALSGNNFLTGGLGDDTITAGSGSDFLHGGDGINTINSGDGNDIILSNAGTNILVAENGDDIIIIAGSSTEGQYDQAAISNVAGTDLDISQFVTLNDINGITSLSSNDIDAGEGNDTLVIYGDAQIDQLDNVEHILLNSTLTISQSALSDILTITGDGTSELILDDSVKTFDLASIDITGLDRISSNSPVTLQLNSLNDLSVVANFDVQAGALYLKSPDGSPLTINTSDLLNNFSSLQLLQLGENVTLVIEDMNHLTTLGLTTFSGSVETHMGGTIIFAEGIIPDHEPWNSPPQSLTGLTFSWSLSTQIENGNTIFADLLGAEMSDNVVLTTNISIFTPWSVNESEMSADIEIFLSDAVSEDASIVIRLADGTEHTVIIPSGERIGTITVTWEDDEIINGNRLYEAEIISLSENLSYLGESETLSFEISDDEREPGGGEDIPGDETTNEHISANNTEPTSSFLFDNTDIDAFNIYVQEDVLYQIVLNTPDGTPSPTITINGHTITPDSNGRYLYLGEATGPTLLSVSNGQGEYSLQAIRHSNVEKNGKIDFEAGIATEASTQIGSTFEATVGSVDDRDWIRVDLEEGQVYQITLLGTSETLDPTIYGIFDANGTGFANSFNNDGFNEGNDSQLLFTAPYTGTFFIEAGGWRLSNTGNYQLNITDVTETHPDLGLPYGENPFSSRPVIFSEDSGDWRIDGLISSRIYAPDPDGQTTSIYFSFANENSVWASNDYDSESEPYSGFIAMNDFQENLFRSLLDHISTLVNIQFVEVVETEDSVGTLRFGWTSFPYEGAAAWAHYPATSPDAGDVWFKTKDFFNGQNNENNRLGRVFLHEVGHALGLSHSHDGPDQIPHEWDSHEYTVMSYNELVGQEFLISSLQPQTLMYFDILTLQYLYGALETNSGDDLYTFDGTQRYYMTLWDTGGNDTIEVINQNNGVIIDLDGANWWDVNTTITYSGIGSGDIEPKTATVYLPEEIIIENVYGDAHDDELSGNAEVNKIRGKGGDDTIDGRGGDDRLDGGTGADTVSGGAGADIFITRDGDGGLLLAGADTILDFTDGEDMIGLAGLNFEDLSITAGTGDNDGDTIITVAATGEYLMVLENVDSSLISAEDFTTIQDEWWVA